MHQYYQSCIDYIEGRISPKHFEGMLENNLGLVEWLQSIVPDTKTMYVCDPINRQSVLGAYRIDIMLKQYELPAFGGPKGSVEYSYFIHKEISKLFSEVYPDVTLSIDPSLKKDYDLCLDICPDYIGGTEVAKANIIGNILDGIPQTLSTSKRKTEAKEKIKEAFHIQGMKHPRWIQEPEWPVYNGKPMKYLHTKRVNKEVYIHYFVDPESGIERSVEDAF